VSVPPPVPTQSAVPPREAAARRVAAPARPHVERSASAPAAAAPPRKTAPTQTPLGEMKAPIAQAPVAAAAAEASFEGRLLQAVQAEARRSYPAAARLMGITGQATVGFDYRDGAVRVMGLTQSSGSPSLDRAALAAVQNASYPPPPAELAGRTLVKVVHVKFELNSN
jgi:protein TonB